MSNFFDERQKLDKTNSSVNKSLSLKHTRTFAGKINSQKFNLDKRILNTEKKLSTKIDNQNIMISKRNSSYLNTFIKRKINYDDIINFNFGFKKSAQLKIINTSSLAINNSEKKINNVSVTKKEKIIKNSLFNKKQFNPYKPYKTNYNYIPENKNNKILNLSQRKSIINRDGILKLPLLSNLIPNTRINYKEKPYKKYMFRDQKIEKLVKQEEYDKINDIFENDNEEIDKKIKEKYLLLDEKIKKYKSKRPNEETEAGIEVLYKKYNEKRAKKFNIITNRTLDINKNLNNFININTLEEIENYNKNKLNNILLDVKGNTRYLINIDDEDNKKNKTKLKDYELTSLANQTNYKVEKLFPDLCAFYLPKILRKNKEYTIKLLYDVFIEFKILLKCGMMHNRNLNLHKKGIDFETFFNCNTKINQQGIALSKKIFKAFNNKTNINYMPWQNYMDGMMKIKDPNIDNKLDLFFQILDENGDGSFDYNEVYNLSLISLQRVLPADKNQDKSSEENEKEEEKESEKEKEKKIEDEEEPNITNLLAEFLTKYVFQLVGIDIDGEIPIDLLREKMDEKNDDAEYLEFFLCADNFA